MNTYQAKPNPIIKRVIAFTAVSLILILIINRSIILDRPFLIVIIILLSLLALWVNRSTHYTIHEEYLSYKAGFMNGKLYIPRITMIENGKTLRFGTKPALASGGMTISFNKFSKLYIAPLNNDEVIANILDIKPDILVID